MFLGSERLRHEAPAGGVGGGIAAWMNVFCTEKPRFPKVQGVSIVGQGADVSGAGGVGVEGNA